MEKLNGELKKIEVLAEALGLSRATATDFVNDFYVIKKLEQLIFVIIEFILTIIKNFCQSELLMCYHMSISPFRWMVD